MAQVAEGCSLTNVHIGQAIGPEKLDSEGGGFFSIGDFVDFWSATFSRLFIVVLGAADALPTAFSGAMLGGLATGFLDPKLCSSRSSCCAS